MHRIDADGHAGNTFTEGDPALSIPATKVSDDWLNAVQEEICNLLQAAGIALDKANNAQLAAACVAAATANRIMRRDAAGRAQVVDPSANADIDTKGARDTAIATHNGVTNPHSATSAATAARLVLRDAAGRAQFADGAAAADAATKGQVDTAIASAVAPLATQTFVTGISSGVVAAGSGWSSVASIIKAANGLFVGQAYLTAGTTPSATIGTLPSGYRPNGATRHFALAVRVGGVYGTRPFSVASTGVLACLDGTTFASGDIVYVDGLTFY